MPSIKFLSAILATVASVSANPVRRAGTVSVTPHEQYSSSVGVLGCLINTNHVAYWPGAVDCDNICVKLTYQGRTGHVLKIDTSGGAHDVSYDMWNFLVFGQSAASQPHQGGGVNMQWENVPMSECSSLLHNGKLPVSASNSVNFIDNCIRTKPNSWVAKNYEFINMLDPVCHFGWNEVCTYNRNVSNQPKCAHQLGDPHQPTGQKVTNIQYGTGKSYTA
ncbi:hypothetical protein PT974_10588 [Cladobotryum mycophilum]|uniref:Cerato-platanin n=1 Tax=Cladobotryum mycophilum TaxID=491253 RepID=A0ABR0SBC0_9HYPO